MKFTKKPVTIEAIQWTGKLECLDPFHIPELHQSLGSSQVGIPTMEGTMIASVGDWVIKGVKGEFYPCKDEIFKLTYEAGESAPRQTDDGSGLSGASDFDLFKLWANECLGQGYSLDTEDGVFSDPVTRWAFKGFKAGLRTASGSSAAAVPPSVQGGVPGLTREQIDEIASAAMQPRHRAFFMLQVDNKFNSAANGGVK